MQWLDRNLFAGEEIKEVYKELSKSKSTQYLNFDEVRYTLLHCLLNLIQEKSILKLAIVDPEFQLIS